jgi:gamma-glutamyl:cysteine ligase YbdK (ATP-grasp superfamily)
MGRDIETTEFTREDRTRYREKVKRCLAALARLVEEGRFETGFRRVGVEMEVYLTDGDGAVMPINSELLRRIASDDWQTELAQFNVEFDVRPRSLAGDVFRSVEADLRRSLDRAQSQAETLDAQVVTIGILPTLTDFDVTEQNLSANPRYHALNDAILAARGEDILLRIEGDETLETTLNSITVEAACTSMQLHLQVDPEEFATYWNAAQVLSAPLVAVAANSPILLGKQLHHETRIALFQQAIDTRTEELASQGVRPRVWFGEKWLQTGIFELFDENVRYFSSLLPICEEEDPLDMLAAGKVPRLPELTLHNGTIYRWNRPVYEVAGDTPHLRVENRVLPAGPTVVDEVANAAFYYGLLSSFASAETPIWSQMSFEAATDNFFAAAQHGLGAKLYWPRVSPEVPVTELVLKHLLPMAREGLARWEVDPGDIDHYLGIIRERALREQNGATWQIATYHRLVRDGGLDRPEAARELVRRYQKLSQAGTPVHTWPIDG